VIDRVQPAAEAGPATPAQPSVTVETQQTPVTGEDSAPVIPE
jgi:hypothetical protein